MKFNYVLKKGWIADSIFWLVYGAFWHFVFAPEPFSIYNAVFTLCMTLAQMATVYVHLNMLMPARDSRQMSVAAYGLLVALLTLLGSVLTWLLLYGVFSLIPYSEGLLASLRLAIFSYWLGPILGGMSTAVAVTGAAHIFIKRRDEERREKELEHEKVNTELQYLRGQLNPHFLFNALNGIYFMIPKNPDRAAEVLVGFSDLLRYQLYRSEDKLVPLSEELLYLERFAELSLMRLEDDFNYEMDIADKNSDCQIPPMLLLPLLENAFKHSPNRNGWIKGKLSLQNEDKLHLSLINNYEEDTKRDQQVNPNEKSGGIGLENIKRRLELLFPHNYQFKIRRTKGIFSVEIEIPLVPSPSLVAIG
ncbi:MAG: histidine kinase [Bacteroidota bacterium]